MGNEYYIQCRRLDWGGDDVDSSGSGTEGDITFNSDTDITIGDDKTLRLIASGDIKLKGFLRGES